jgi:hypothetical protein
VIFEPESESRDGEECLEGAVPVTSDPRLVLEAPWGSVECGCWDRVLKFRFIVGMEKTSLWEGETDFFGWG